MYICICNAVTEREIQGAIELGSRSLSDLKRDLGVAGCCGKCEPDARRILGDSVRGGRRHATFAPGD